MNTLETINTTDTGATTAVEWCTLADIAADPAIRQKSILSRRQPPRPPQDEQIGNDEGNDEGNDSDNDSTCGNQDFGRTATDFKKYMEEANAKIIEEMVAKKKAEEKAKFEAKVKEFEVKVKAEVAKKKAEEKAKFEAKVKEFEVKVKAEVAKRMAE